MPSRDRRRGNELVRESREGVYNKEPAELGDALLVMK